eukprot:CAMPEP_0184395722 /NCGR_PEP_ID=MMETSP0007-20130409/45791_1 /TAXON_ID=97485 /ORGANISM="Prymnesium parvum, Strain Texoma1" /LENGTH=103 /DNA_ID=CAMNT_0026748095 /DNA_START=141 /DNA_END=449 /DNA_ORIENTATION=-
MCASATVAHANQPAAPCAYCCAGRTHAAVSGPKLSFDSLESGSSQAERLAGVAWRCWGQPRGGQLAPASPASRLDLVRSEPRRGRGEQQSRPPPRLWRWGAPH